MRHIGFDGVGVPGLDEYPSGLQGVVFFLCIVASSGFPLYSRISNFYCPGFELSLINTLGYPTRVPNELSLINALGSLNKHP